MTVEKLERVLWRLRKHCPNNKHPQWKELKRCIMLEIGTDPRTYQLNRKALKELNWIRSHDNYRLTLTNKDLE